MSRFSSLLTLGFAVTLTASAVANATSGDTLYIQSDNVNVYEAPSVDAPVLMHLDQGQKLKEFRRQGAWVKVIIYGEIGKDGWIRDVDLGPEAPNETAPAPGVQQLEKPLVPVQHQRTWHEKIPVRHFLFVIPRASGEFRGSCLIATETGKEVHYKLSRFTSYKFKAKAVSCVVKAPFVRKRVIVRKQGIVRKRGIKLFANGKLISCGRRALGSREGDCFERCTSNQNIPGAPKIITQCSVGARSVWAWDRWPRP